MLQKKIAAAMVAILFLTATQVAAADIDGNVRRLVAFVQSSPHKETISQERRLFSLRLVVEKEEIELFVQTKENDTGFAIKGEYVVTAAESSYSIDTPCEVKVVAMVSDPTVVGIMEWNCIAWTPTMEKFVNDAGNRKRVFDSLVQRAARMLPPT